MLLTWFSREDTPILKGQRVRLRAPRLADHAEWRALRSQSRDFLRPFEPRWTEADLAQRVFAARLRRARDEARAGTDYGFFIFIEDGRGGETLVGGLTLSNIRRRAAQFVNLGYWMGEPFAGKGLMSEAVATVLPFVFGSLDLHRIHAAFMPHNAPSRRVLEKNGFREEGYAENFLQIDGRWADHVLFGLTRERYLAFNRPQRP